jgi:Stage II sporulation protein E (SpoIIE)
VTPQGSDPRSAGPGVAGAGVGLPLPAHPAGKRDHWSSMRGTPTATPTPAPPATRPGPRGRPLAGLSELGDLLRAESRETVPRQGVRGTVHTLVACRCAAGRYPAAAAVNDRPSGHEQPLGEEPPPIRTPSSSQTSVKWALLRVGLPDAVGLGDDAVALRLENLEALTDATLTPLDVDDLLVELLARVREILDVDTAAVLMLDAGSEVLVAGATFPDVESSPPIGASRWSSGTNSVVLVAARHSTTITLAPGSVAAFYTDRLIERSGESIDLGLERLRDVTTPGPPERVAADIMRHLIGNTATTDDIALVVMGRSHPTERMVCVASVTRWSN